MNNLFMELKSIKLRPYKARKKSCHKSFSNDTVPDEFSFFGENICHISVRFAVKDHKLGML